MCSSCTTPSWFPSARSWRAWWRRVTWAWASRPAKRRRGPRPLASWRRRSPNWWPGDSPGPWAASRRVRVGLSSSSKRRPGSWSGWFSGKWPRFSLDRVFLGKPATSPGLDRVLRPTVEQRPEPVQGGQQRRPVADQRGADRSGESQQGQADGRAVGVEVDAPALPDQADRLAGDVEGLGDLPQAFFQECDLRRLASDVRGSMDSDPDVRLGQAERVIDPVADHGDRPPLALERPDKLGLFLGENPGDDAVDPDRPGDRACDVFRVAGQHDDLVQTARPQRLHDLDRLGS